MKGKCPGPLDDGGIVFFVDSLYEKMADVNGSRLLFDAEKGVYGCVDIHTTINAVPNLPAGFSNSRKKTFVRHFA